MSNQNSSKGNPASKRMSNAKLKVRRAFSWARGEARKAARRKVQDEAHRRNLTTGTSPWKQAKAERYARRHSV